MSDVTRRFRAEGTVPYVQALVELSEYARGHGAADFEVYPGNVSAVKHNGIAVTGPVAVVGALTDLLGERVPGLYEVDA